MAEVAELASLDRGIGSESEDASDSSGSRAEVIAACGFENTQYAESRDRSDDTIDALMARLAPSIRKHVEEALLPLVSALRSQEENEQKHREKLLGLEMEKLVLERKRLLFKQRRAAPCPAPYRNSPRSKRHKDRVKKNPPTQRDQAVVVAVNGCLRENKNLAGIDAHKCVRRKAKFDSNMRPEREAQKLDFGASDGNQSCGELI